MNLILANLKTMGKKTFSKKSKKYTDVYKLSKDKEDALDALKKRVVKFKTLIEFDGESKEFISKITTKTSGYVYIKGQGLTHLWWYDDEEWFMNVAHQNFSKIEKSGWFIAKDLPTIISSWKRQGAKFYFKPE